MTKQTGTIITIVVAVFALCCSMTCCVSGAITMANDGQWLGDYIDASGWYWGIAPCCLSILVLIVPLLLWLFLVRGKENAVEEDIWAEENIAV